MVTKAQREVAKIVEDSIRLFGRGTAYAHLPPQLKRSALSMLDRGWLMFGDKYQPIVITEAGREALAKAEA